MFSVLPILLATVLCVPASAQTVALSTGVGVNTRASIQPVVTLGVNLRNVSLLGGFGLSTRLLGDIGPGGGLEVSGLFEWPLDDLSEQLTLYGGPGAALTFADALLLRPSLVAGLDYDLDGQLSLFTEGSYQIEGPFRVRAGVTYLF